MPARQGVSNRRFRRRAAARRAVSSSGFWESWSDTNGQDAYSRLGSVPGSVTTVDVAFSIADGNEISDPQNTYPLAPGRARIHARGGKVLLSFGGATSTFDITDPHAFVTNLKAYLRSIPASTTASISTTRSFKRAATGAAS